MAAKIRNGKNSISASLFHRLMTSAIEQPMMSVPPINSPQRIFFSSMNTAIHSAKLRRGAVGTGTTSRGTGSGDDGVAIGASTRSTTGTYVGSTTGGGE